MIRAMARILGVDYGERAIGLAVSDELGLTARALCTLRRGKNEAKWACIGRIENIAREHGVSAIVVGLPKNMDNSLGEQADKTTDFGQRLTHALPDIPIVYRDERLTSRLAQRVLIDGDFSKKHRRQALDQMAAQIILQDYLDELASARTHRGLTY